MFNDDDFFLSDDELAEDNQLSIVDSARLDLLESIKTAVDNMIGNIKFNEQSDANNNCRIIAGYLDHLIVLGQIDTMGLSDEEVFEKIEEVMKSTTELTFKNIDDVLPEPEENSNMGMEDLGSDDGTDW